MCQAFLVQVMLNSRKQVNGWMNKWENPLGTVSKWCSNSSQPDLVTLEKTAKPTPICERCNYNIHVCMVLDWMEKISGLYANKK